MCKFLSNGLQISIFVDYLGSCFKYMSFQGVETFCYTLYNENCLKREGLGTISFSALERLRDFD